MNRAHELRDRNSRADQAAAIEAYSRAISLLNETSYCEDSALANSLGSALMNRGQLVYAMDGCANGSAAIDDFEEGVRILSPHAISESPWPKRNLAGTWVNHANILLDLDRPLEALRMAEAAIAIVIAPTLDPVDAELAVLARRSACDAIGYILPSLIGTEQTELAIAASHQVDEALAVVRSLRPLLASEPFPEASERLFRFGCRLYALHRPESLRAFVGAHLGCFRDDQLVPRFVASAREALAIAMDTLSRDLLSATTSFDQLDTLERTAQELTQLFQELSVGPIPILKFDQAQFRNAY